MRLAWVELDRFRNLEQQKVRLHPRYNLLLGRNGQGKTNFLEAIGFLGSLRSFRSAGRGEMIRRGENMCRVSGEVFSGNLSRNLTFSLTAKGRIQFLEDRKVQSPEEYLRVLKVVHFTPEDVSLISGSPSWRRKVIDRAVFEIMPGYVSEYRRYLTALRQRNALLRDGRASDTEIESWSRGLASDGAVLVKRRWDLLLALNPRMGKLGEKLGLGRGLHLTYIPSCPMTGAGTSGKMSQTARSDIADDILRGLTRTEGRERRAGHTLVGPHRDNMLFVAGSGEAALDLSRYGSQGQKRSAVLAFKVALADVFRESGGEWPIVLLDDVASELDSTRRRALGEIVRGMEAQFLISTTGEEYMFLPAEEGNIWQVCEGRLEEHPIPS